MKEALGLVASIVLIGLVLWSALTFTVAMFVTGQIGWLIVGWFAIPVTVIVWPILLGAWWTWPFYIALVVAGGTASWADVLGGRR